MGRGTSVHFLGNSTEPKLLQQVVLNKRRITLKKVLLKYMGFVLSRDQPDLKVEDIEYAGLGEEFYAVSTLLGIEPGQGLLQADPVAIEVNGIAFALDDESQFNKFRFQTLQSSVYALPLIHNLNRYKSYCLQESTPSTDGSIKKSKDRSSMEKKKFPSESLLRVQALNDFMQDLLPLVHFVPVLRLSVFDQLETPKGGVSLHKLLMEGDETSFSLLADHIMKQLEGLEEVFNLEY